MPDLFDAVTGAKSLLGWELVHHTPAGDIGGIIRETEAYDEADPASHSFRGRTKRTAPMFEGAGTLYLYFIYGMYWCLNIVTGPPGHGQAVLIRALKPTRGVELMQANRNTTDLRRLTHGPGALVIALDIPPSYSGLHIAKTDLELVAPTEPVRFKTGTRVGITKGTDVPWRFYVP